jgi:hypothetical protein
MIDLNEFFQHAIDECPDQPVPVIDRRTNTKYVLVRADLFHQMEASLKHDLDIREAYPLMDAVARTEGWDDPEMDSYDVYARKPQQ